MCKRNGFLNCLSTPFITMHVFLQDPSSAPRFSSWRRSCPNIWVLPWLITAPETSSSKNCTIGYLGCGTQNHLTATGWGPPRCESVVGCESPIHAIDVSHTNPRSLELSSPTYLTMGQLPYSHRIWIRLKPAEIQVSHNRAGWRGTSGYLGDMDPYGFL